jgi:LysM repeat protein
MIALRACGRWGVTVMLSLLCAGCFPVAESDSSEKKDPHYIKGRNLANALDYQGAAEAFDKALDANPRNSAAHLELGILNEERFGNFAAAIYHYEKFLQFNPNSLQAANLRGRLVTCKQELAKSVYTGPVTPAMQKELERLTAENIRLNKLTEDLQMQLARSAATISNLTAQAAQQPRVAVGGPLNRLAPQERGTASQPGSAATAHDPSVIAGSVAGPPKSGPGATTSRRAHTVKPRETPASIARKYGVSVNALLKANPGLDPRRMKIGQTVNLPAS